MRTEFLCISVLRVASGPRVKLGSCKSALNPPVVCSTDRSKAVVPVLVSLFVALWFILRGDLLYVFPCVILFLCFSVLLVLRLPRLGKRELILVLFVRLFGLCLFRFVGFLFLLGSGKGCGLWLWHSLDFSLTFFTVLVFCRSSHGASHSCKVYKYITETVIFNVQRPITQNVIKPDLWFLWSKCHLMLLYIFARLQDNPSYRKGTSIWLGSLFTMSKGQ